MSGSKEIGSNTEGSSPERVRATPVRPAVWMTSVIAWATVIALFLHVPTWAGIFLCILTALSFLSFLVPYTYLMIYDREALRRECFSPNEPSTKQLAAADPPIESLLAGDREMVAINMQPLDRK